MTTNQPTLQWSETLLPAKILDSKQLDKILDDLNNDTEAEFPLAVRLSAFDCSVDILLGLEESFVYVDEVNPTRYFITIGDPDANGVIGFYLFGQHHTEFYRRHLIPITKARQVLREFYETGHRSSDVQWEEGQY